MKQSMKHLAAALALCLPFAAGAHDVWVVPSSTVLSGADSWITVDAAVGNDKFHFNHAPLRLDGLAVTAPDGSAAEAENLNRGSCAAPSTCSSSRAAPTAWPWSTTACSRAGRKTASQALFRQARGHGPGRACQGRRAGSLAKPGPRRDLRHRRQAQRRQARGPRPGTGARHAPERPVRGRDRHLPDAAGRPARPGPGNDHRGRRHRYRDQVGEIKAKTDKDGKFSVGRSRACTGSRPAWKTPRSACRRPRSAACPTPAPSKCSSPDPAEGPGRHVRAVSYAPGRAAPVARGPPPALAAGPAGRRAGGRHHGHHLVGPAGAARGLRRNLRAPGHPGRAGRGGGRDEHLGRPQRHHPLQPRRPGWRALAGSGTC